jgi:endonuclease YncB( thermonuclease family)
MLNRSIALTFAAAVSLPLFAQTPQPAGARPAPKPQPRIASSRVAVDPALVRVDDGDTVVIQWSREDAEIVRILGIDTPETQHYAHNLPFDQPFGAEARAFARGAFSAATKVEILRAATLDPFGRSLAYCFINGQNYSILVLKARLAEESITAFGDNGFPEEAAAVLAVAKAAGPLPFQPPHEFRARMREVTRYLKDRGEYPSE